MSIVIKKMETEEEIRGKGYVHWKAWQETYPGLISQEYLDNNTLERCERAAFMWTDNVLVAKDDESVIGFCGYGREKEQEPETGEVYAIYVLKEYYGKGVGLDLMNTALQMLKEYKRVCVWALKENHRAIRFYEKCGFLPDGKEMLNTRIDAKEIRMTLDTNPYYE